MRSVGGWPADRILFSASGFRLPDDSPKIASIWGLIFVFYSPTLAIQVQALALGVAGRTNASVPTWNGIVDIEIPTSGNTGQKWGTLRHFF